MNITKVLTNNNINFSRQDIPHLDARFVNISKQPKDTFEKAKSIDINPSNNRTINNKMLNVLGLALFAAGSIAAVVGTKKILKMPSKKDVLLNKFLDGKVNELSNITDVFKTNVKTLYEKHLAEFKKLFNTPDNKLPQAIQDTVSEIENAKTIQELFGLEDKAVTGIYEWFKSSKKQQKPATEFVKHFNKFKEELSNEVKKLQKEATTELEKPLDIPKNLKKTKHSKKILQKFNDEVLGHEKYKVERIADYVDTIADEDAKALYLKYNEDFDKLLMTKNRALSQLIKLSDNSKNRILQGKENLISDNVTNNLPESITSNKFFQFANANKKDGQDWMNFIKDDMGKDLSYKDIDVLEQRLLLRAGIFADKKTIDKFTKDRTKLFEFFKKTVTQKAPEGFDEKNITGLKRLDAVDMANSIKDKYGDSNFICMLKDLTNSTFMDSGSLLFKLESIMNKYTEKYNKSYFDRLLIRDKNYFNWEEIL